MTEYAVNPANFTPEKLAEVRITNETTGGQKGSKLARFDLVPTRSLTALAEHFGKGAEKYAARNWERGVDWSLNYAALMRHMTQWWGGEDVDEEGNSHLAAAMWHSAVLIEYSHTHPELDDRPEHDKFEKARDFGVAFQTVYSDDLPVYATAAYDPNQGTWTETLENGTELVFVHSDSPTTYQDMHANEKHREWNARQIARCDEWQAAWHEEQKEKK